MIKKQNGGYRPGCGRPEKKEEKLVPISGTVTEKTRMRVEFEAKNRGISVSEYIREAIIEKIKFDECMDKMDANEKINNEITE